MRKDCWGGRGRLRHIRSLSIQAKWATKNGSGKKPQEESHGNHFETSFVTRDWHAPEATIEKKGGATTLVMILGKAMTKRSSYIRIVTAAGRPYSEAPEL